MHLLPLIRCLCNCKLGHLLRQKLPRGHSHTTLPASGVENTMDSQTKCHTIHRSPQMGNLSPAGRADIQTSVLNFIQQGEDRIRTAYNNMEQPPEHRAEVKGPERAVCLCSQGLPSPVSKSESLSPTAALRVGLEGPCGAPRKLASVWIPSLRYFPVAMAKHHGQGRL